MLEINVNTHDTSLHDKRPIGIFDSGVGGLTVARSIHTHLPHESIIYLGDTARVPYGNRGADTIKRYSINAAHLLMEQNIKALVIACNTASAHGLAHLTEHLNIPTLGVIDPVAKQAAERTQTGHIAVIGTRGTVKSACYQRAIKNHLKDARITQIACPLFVPLAEEGWTQGPVPREVAQTYLAGLNTTDVDTLILGCTHYPLLRDTIASVLDTMMSRHVALLDSARATSQIIETTLKAHNLTASLQDTASLRFLVTDEPCGFMRTAVRFFGGKITPPEHINIVDQEGLL